MLDRIIEFIYKFRHPTVPPDRARQIELARKKQSEIERRIFLMETEFNMIMMEVRHG